MTEDDVKMGREIDSRASDVDEKLSASKHGGINRSVETNYKH